MLAFAELPVTVSSWFLFIGVFTEVPKLSLLLRSAAFRPRYFPGETRGHFSRARAFSFASRSIEKETSTPLRVVFVMVYCTVKTSQLGDRLACEYSRLSSFPAGLACLQFQF